MFVGVRVPRSGEPVWVGVVMMFVVLMLVVVVEPAVAVRVLVARVQ